MVPRSSTHSSAPTARNPSDRFSSRLFLALAGLYAATLVLYVVPLPLGPITANLVATSLSVVWMAAMILILPSHLYLHKVGVLFGVAALSFVAFLNAISSAGNVVYVLTSLRYTLAIPVAGLTIGYFLGRSRHRLEVLTLTPSAAVGILLMFLAFGSPFVGEIRPGEYVGELSRFYLHPVDGSIVYPVSLAENCSAGFMMLWFAMFSKRLLPRALCAVLGLASVALSVAGATRSYLFANAIVLGIFGVAAVFRAGYRRQITVLAIGTVLLVIGLFAVESTREAILVRLDRFILGGWLDNSERMSIWSDRLDYAMTIGPFEGTAMSDYFEQNDISSHNIALDWVIIGGWVYACAIGAIYAYGAARAMGSLLTKNCPPELLGLSACVLMCSLVLMISSPIVSSLYAYAIYWHILGAYWGRFEHQRLANLAGARERRQESPSRPWHPPGRPSVDLTGSMRR